MLIYLNKISGFTDNDSARLINVLSMGYQQVKWDQRLPNLQIHIQILPDFQL